MLQPFRTLVVVLLSIFELYLLTALERAPSLHVVKIVHALNVMIDIHIVHEHIWAVNTRDFFVLEPLL